MHFYKKYIHVYYLTSISLNNAKTQKKFFIFIKVYS